MTDTEAEPPAAATPVSGGPSWLHNTRGTPSQVASSAPPTMYPGTSGASGAHGPTPGSSEELFTARYNRNGVTPIPYMVVGLLSIAAAWWALDWARWTPSSPERFQTNEWWVNITTVLVPGESHGFGAYSNGRMWIALGLLMVSALCIAVWVGRIGTNVRTGNQPFGAALPLLAFPAWWILPITLGLTSDAGRSHSDLLLRNLVAFAILFAQFMLLRWPTLNRIWRAGRFPYDMASIVLWLPMLIPWAMIFLSDAFTYFTIGTDGKVADSSWRSTPAMYDWARWITRLSGVGMLLLCIAVSVAQHIGMGKDRFDDAAARTR